MGGDFIELAITLVTNGGPKLDEGVVDITRTWVPSTDFEECARVLCRQHLVAQVSEGLMVLRALAEPDDGAGWRRHPCARMWRGYERAFCEYQLAVVREHRRRGYRTVVLHRYLEFWGRLPGPTRLPPWWGVHSVHATDRETLVARYPEHYAEVWPGTQPRDVANWPVPYGAMSADVWVPGLEPLPVLEVVA